MNSVKCPECGLVNPSSAKQCKRCLVSFHRPVREIPPSGNRPLAAADNERTPQQNQQRATLPALPDYLAEEPAPFTQTVIVFIVWLALTVLFTGYELKVCIDFVMNSASDPATGAMAYLTIPSAELLIYLLLIAKGVRLLAALALLFMLPSKSSSFIKWVAIYLIAGMVFQVVEILAIVSIRSSYTQRELSRPFDVFMDWPVTIAAVCILAAPVWLAYFKTSRRVRKVFIN